MPMSGPLLSIWVSGPVAVLALGAMTWYSLRLRSRPMPRTRRRLRKMGTLVHLLLVPMLVYALSIVDPSTEPGRFLVAWLCVLLLVAVTLVVALLDIANNIRLHRAEKRLLARDLGLRSGADVSPPRIGL